VKRLLAASVVALVLVGGLGIYYTGRSEFTVGLDLGWQRISQRGADNVLNLGQARISLRYDF